MNNLTVTRRDNTTYQLADFGNMVMMTDARQLITLLNEDVVKVTVEAAAAQNYAVGDSITVFGRLYKLNQPPKIKKESTRKYTCELTFEGVQYDLMRVAYLLSGNTVNSELQDVWGNNLIGDLTRFAQVLITNANRVFPGEWILGVVEGEDKTINIEFSESDNCLSVLQSLCTEFDTEFVINNNGINTLNFIKVSTVFQYPLKYGANKGLYNLSRDNASTNNQVTRLYAYGSSENITERYRADRLCLPGKVKNNSYIEESYATLPVGIFEKIKYFDEIKPERIGTVSALVPDNVNEFIDNAMFNLNAKWQDNGDDYQEWLALKGLDDTTGNHDNYTANVTGNSKYLLTESAQLTFNTGSLAGLVNFNIASYDHNTHKFTLNPYEEKGYKFPSEDNTAFRIAVGDMYVLTNIALPKSYITNAETRLKNKANQYYAENFSPLVKYTLEIDRMYLKDRYAATDNIFTAGQSIHITDAEVGVDKDIRIQSIERDILDPYSYKIILSDTPLRKKPNRWARDIAIQRQIANEALQRTVSDAQIDVKKLNVADVIDSLDAKIEFNNKKALSQSQGVVLKNMIEAVGIRENIGLQEDPDTGPNSFMTIETFVPSSTRLFLNGQLLYYGQDYDEYSNNGGVTLTRYDVRPDDRLFLEAIIVNNNQ
ncbi:MAG: phage tail protein [Bacteroidales bacterium]|jgi:hypothetical protein|nr:phage tail protein [Bacteroidales bacterium]